MINLISNSSIECISLSDIHGNCKPVKRAQKDHTRCSHGDCYVSNNPNKNLKHGLKSGDVQYVKPTKILWGLLTLREGYYSYSCNGRETIGDIKKKFGIPDGIISEMNGIKDDEHCPEIGKELVFRYKD